MRTHPGNLNRQNIYAIGELTATVKFYPHKNFLLYGPVYGISERLVPAGFSSVGSPLSFPSVSPPSAPFPSDDAEEEGGGRGGRVTIWEITGSAGFGCVRVNGSSRVRSLGKRRCVLIYNWSVPPRMDTAFQ